MILRVLWYNGMYFNGKSRIMSEQPLTYEGILELFRKAERRMKRFEQERKQERKEYEQKRAQARKEYELERKETERLMKERDAAFDRRMQKTERIARKASRSVSKLGNRIGDIIENMVGGNALIRKFKKLDYKIDVSVHGISPFLRECIMELAYYPALVLCGDSIV